MLLFLTAIASWMLATAQLKAMQSDTWKIKWGKRTIVETGKEDEVANKKTAKKDELNRNYCLEIAYAEADATKEKEWTRSFLLFDDQDHELLRVDSTRLARIPAADLKKALGEGKIVKVYTIALPTDPDMAARVRVRRVHLGTIEFK